MKFIGEEYQVNRETLLKRFLLTIMLTGILLLWANVHL